MQIDKTLQENTRLVNELKKSIDKLKSTWSPSREGLRQNTRAIAAIIK